MAEDDDVIVLDLLPSSQSAGRLREQSTDEYLYITSAKSLYHFEVKPHLRAHGRGDFEANGETIDASILVLSIKARSEQEARPYTGLLYKSRSKRTKIVPSPITLLKL